MHSVSIHAFRGEGDGRESEPEQQPEFQSTPSGGKATRCRQTHPACSARFNPRLPGGRRLVTLLTLDGVEGFNPRLPGGRRPRCAARG